MSNGLLNVSAASVTLEAVIDPFPESRIARSLKVGDSAVTCVRLRVLMVGI